MKSKVNFKNLILSVVALILVMMLTVGVTYSWIEDVKQVQFSTKQEGDEAPLKTGTDINAEAEIVKDNSTINLGNILGDSDLKDTNTGNFKSNLNPDTGDIAKKKGYFYESGDMHLSPCYSDGIDFYFPKEGGGYRKGNKNDENVNYIDFTFKVSSPTANTAYWFDQNGNDPWFSILDSNDNHINNACMSITVDGITKVFTWSPLTGISKNGSTSSGNTYNTTRAADYTYGDGYNTDNANTLFTVAKGTEKNVNVKIWIESDGTSSGATVSKSNIDIKLTSSWAKEISFNLEDKTSGWAITSTDSFYVAFPEYYETYNGWVEGKNYFSCNTNSSNHNGSFSVPAVYSGEYAYIYRCSTDWDAGANNLPTPYDTREKNTHPIHAHNYWKTTLPNSYKPTNTNTYKFYGGAYDAIAAKAIEGNENKATHLGCGTWESIISITLYSKYKCTQNYFSHHENETQDVNFATPDSSAVTYIRDFSDERTVGSIYTYKMTWDTDHWWTNVPVSSKLIQFYYYLNDNTKGWWGYRCDNDTCPQQRPDNETVYHITGNHGEKKGLAGYWGNENCVYLIKNGTLWDSTPYLYMWTWRDNNGGKHTNAYNDEFPGPQLTNHIGDTTDGDWIYKSGDIYGGTFMWEKGIFSNGSSSLQTQDLTLYAGCYYDWAAGKWYGSLEKNEIAHNVTDTSRDTSLEEGTTSYPPSDGNVYLSVTLNGDIRYYKIGNAVNDTIKINLAASNYYTVRLIKNTEEYARTNTPNSNDYIDASAGQDTDFNKGHQPHNMRVPTTGKYNVKIISTSGSDNYRIKFSSASS